MVADAHPDVALFRLRLLNSCAPTLAVVLSLAPLSVEADPFKRFVVDR